MSKSTYKRSMRLLRQPPKKQRMADDVKTIPFIPSKDFVIERAAIGEARFRMGKRNAR